jgi:hypothetical protein
MNDSKSIANNVSRWTGLGVKLPKELAEAVSVFESLVYTEVGYQPVFDIGEVTATNGEEKIKEFADQLVLAEVPGGGLSVLGKAKNIAVDAAARRVNALARVAVPDLIELLTPEFDRHAEAYIEAVAKLPGVPIEGTTMTSPYTITADALVSAGAEAVTAYGDAQREVQYLNRISTWVFETSYLSGVIPKDAEVVLRILRPSTALELVKLDEAASKRAESTLAAINPVFFTAARLGVKFGINTLREAAELRTSLSTISTVGATFR